MREAAFEIWMGSGKKVIQLHYVFGTGCHRYDVIIDMVGYAQINYVRDEWIVYPGPCTPEWLTIDDLQELARIAGRLHDLLTFR